MAILGWLLETVVLAVGIVNPRERVRERGFPVKAIMAAQGLTPTHGAAEAVALVLRALQQMRTLPVMAVLGFNRV